MSSKDVSKDVSGPSSSSNIASGSGVPVEEDVVTENPQSPADDAAAPEAAENQEEQQEPPQPQHVCDICGAVYRSEKGMFGHLRCHKNRTWRGAYSPPVFSIEEFAEYREHLIKSEEEQLREIEAEEAAAAAAAAAPRVQLDLNVEAEPEEEQEEEEEEGEFKIPDLNFPAPNDD